jgi:hypothetical protein
MQYDNPIVITGPPRSGTTWMQFFLCSHPNIYIHGQEPKLSWKESIQWLDKMTQAGEWGEKSNRSKTVKDYAIPHYSGSGPQRCESIWRKMIYEFISGYGNQKSGQTKWGHKALWLCAREKEVKTLLRVWSNAKWIVCIRDPFLSFESQKNTFVKKQNLEEWIDLWMKSYEFYKSNNESFLFQIDKLSQKSNEEKEEVICDLLRFLGESKTAETDRFISEWKVVHKARPDGERDFRLGDKRRNEMFEKYSKLKTYMQELGYKNG